MPPRSTLGGAMTAAVLAAMVGLSACGGSNPDSPASPPAAAGGEVSISGTAATGLALARARVDIKCASKSGTTTTDDAGQFSASIAEATLPCIVRVSGTSEGVAVVMHSITSAVQEAGATAVTANVTPLTEMIVAQITGGLPEAGFERFELDDKLRPTREQVQAAAASVVTALRTSTGIDLSNIDPIGARLIAATADDRGRGNDYDRALDSLRLRVPPEALPIIVGQIAAATAGGTVITLAEIMDGVKGGSLASCPFAVSGKYRTIDYLGGTRVHRLDFAAMRMLREDGAPYLSLTADPTRPCEFTASGTVEGEELRLDVVVGRQGVGAYRVENKTSARSSIGYLFPVQSHSYSALRGAWTTLESGYLVHTPIAHLFSRVEFTDSRTLTGCDYVASSNWACVPLPATPTNNVRETPGGFIVGAGTSVGATLYLYRAPNGSFALFGTSNPLGSSNPGQDRTVIVASRGESLVLPAVGATTRFWDLQVLRGATDVTAIAVSSDAVTIKSADLAAQTITRERASDKRIDTLRINKPFKGVRARDAGTTNGVPFVAAIQFPMLDVGLTATVNLDQASGATSFYAISAIR